MIEVRGEEDELEVLISGKGTEILDGDEDHILAECKLSDTNSNLLDPVVAYRV